MSCMPADSASLFGCGAAIVASPELPGEDGMSGPGVVAVGVVGEVCAPPTLNGVGVDVVGRAVGLVPSGRFADVGGRHIPSGTSQGDLGGELPGPAQDPLNGGCLRFFGWWLRVCIAIAHCVSSRVSPVWLGSQLWSVASLAPTTVGRAEADTSEIPDGYIKLYVSR